MLTYVYFGANDLEQAIAFYDATLAPLGMQRCITGDPEWDRVSAGWGIYEDGGLRELAFWIGTPFDQRPASVGNGSMVAFRARSWREVDDFHAAALAHGGASDGAPGLRLHYAPDFYAAYVRDPDGNKLAAVCRGDHRAALAPQLAADGAGEPQREGEEQNENDKEGYVLTSQGGEAPLAFSDLDHEEHGDEPGHDPEAPAHR